MILLESKLKEPIKKALYNTQEDENFKKIKIIFLSIIAFIIFCIIINKHKTIIKECLKKEFKKLSLLIEIFFNN